MPRFSLLLTLLMFAPSWAQADSFRPEPLRPGRKISIQGYAKQNPACRAWTNGCVLCVSDGSISQCSTPGIACEPHGITCKEMRHE